MLFDVFLSYNSKDKKLVEEIATRLKYEMGIQLYFDQWHIKPGDIIFSRLEDALTNCGTVAIFLGPHGWGGWQKQELQLAINLSVVTNGKVKVIPILLPGANKADLGWLATRAWVDFSKEITSTSFKALVSSIKNKNLLYYLDNEFVRPTPKIELPEEKKSETGSLKQRLNREAMYLTEIGFDVELDFISDGFGLVLPLSDIVTLGYWIPLDFPISPPKVVFAKNGLIQEIVFGDLSWSPEITLADITASIVEEEVLPYLT